MEVVKHFVFLLITAAVAVQGADFSLAIGPTAAAIAPGDTSNAAIKKSLLKDANTVMAVRAENCADPSKALITGTAEGMVNGKRSSVNLHLIPGTVPGASIVSREWSQPGFWVVSLTGVCGAAKASAIVPFDATGNYIRESSKFYPRPATGAEVEALLKTLAGGKQ